MITSIIGCGNPNRRDDGAGVFVVHQLLQNSQLKERDDLRFLDAGTSGLEVMFAARGSSSLIIIDANQSGSPPGTIFKVTGEELENLPVANVNLHDFRWDQAIYTGKQIFKRDFPLQIDVFLIEAEELDLGIGLSETVEKACRLLVATITDLVS